MNRRGKLVTAALVALGIAGGAAWLIWNTLASPTQAAPATQPSRLSTRNGQTFVILTVQEESQSNLQLQRLEASTYKPEFIAQGTFIEDPAASMTLRAPFAGTLRAAEGRPWPTIGDSIDGTVAYVDPRYTPIENVDVISRLTSAEADVTTATSALAAARSEYEADVKLNQLNKNVSDRTVQDARAAMEQQVAKLESAQQTAALLKKTLAATTQPATSSAFTLKEPWQVAEVGAHPGETVDAGQILLRLVHWNHLLATVALRPGETLDPNTISVKVVAEGQQDHTFQVTHVALASAVDPKTLGETFLLQIDAGAAPVRPGTPVIATFTPTAKGREGLLIPQDAVVWHDGKSWVYVEVQPHQFTRREITTNTPVNNGWFLPLPASGLSIGDQVVLQGAQQLLSEEFKPVIPASGDVDDD